MVKSVEIKGRSIPFDRVLTFSDGSKRIEQVDQIDKQHKFLSYRFKDESLPKGVVSVSIAVFTKNVNGSTEVKWHADIEGEKEAKKALVEQLNKEFDAYLSGLDNMIKNSVPAQGLE
ncbi:hypothetical protein D3C80_1565470 [compost metagenome]